METIAEELKDLKGRGLFRRLKVSEGPAEASLVIDGQKVINLSSNNYLGLSLHPELIQAAQEALTEYGCSETSSPLLSGHSELHERLEARLARFQGTEAALVFNSGYAANLGVISSLMGEGDIIFSDQWNHASIIDGCRLSRAKVQVYPHKDLEALDEMLKGADRFRRRLIVTESVFSMDGDLAPLKGIVRLAEEHDAWLMIDEAHAFGVLGKGGRGLAQREGVDHRVQIRMGTFGKAGGSFGAYIVGKRELINYLINRCRPFIYSTALPAHLCAVALKALDLVEAGDDRRERLWENAARFREGLKSLGFNTMESETQIVPVLLGDARITAQVGEALLREGFFAPAIRPPSVPVNGCRIRCSVTAGHAEDELGRALEAFSKVGKNLGLL